MTTQKQSGSVKAKRPGSLPAFCVWMDGRVIFAKTRFALLPGHDVYDVTSLPPASGELPATT
jgi:hypothetical protein